MDNDFTVTSAYITAIAAIIAPAITALIHSVKEYKIYKMSHTIDERLKLSCKKLKQIRFSPYHIDSENKNRRKAHKALNVRL